MKSDYHTMEDLVMTKRNHLEVDYYTRQEKTQEIEEDWISSVLGSQDDTISELVYANS